MISGWNVNIANPLAWVVALLWVVAALILIACATVGASARLAYVGGQRLLTRRRGRYLYIGQHRDGDHL